MLITVEIAAQQLRIGLLPQGIPIGRNGVFHIGVVVVQPAHAGGQGVNILLFVFALDLFVYLLNQVPQRLVLNAGQHIGGQNAQHGKH